MRLITFINHSSITLSSVIKIAELKHIAWPQHSVREHINWIYKNTDDKSLHCIYDDYKAYLSINRIIVYDGKKELKINGIGNVCSVGDHNGVKLLKIITKRRKCMLFCSEKMKPYYLKLGFKELTENTLIKNIKSDKLTYQNSKF